MTIAKKITAAGIAGMLALSAGSVMADDASLPADQVTSAIEAAVKAHPGEVKEVDVEEKDGNKIVEVEIQGADGKEHDVRVNSATGEVEVKKGLF